jgi:hypothetical protein
VKLFREQLDYDYPGDGSDPAGNCNIEKNIYETFSRDSGALR